MLKVAILGFWHVHATGYAETIRDHPGTELVAVWDPDPVRGVEAAERWGVPFVRDLDTVLSSDVEAVVVTTATVEHADVMVRAAAAGKHVFAEKLLGVDLAEVDTILEAARGAGVAFTVALPRLHEHYTLTVDRLLRSGEYGDLTYARVRLAHDGSIKDWLPKRFYDPDEAVGGALTDLGCHPVYLLDHFFGRLPESVSAVYGQMTGRGVDDNSVVTFRYAGGAIGVAETGFVTPGYSPFTIELHWNRASLFYGHGGDGFQLWADGGPRSLEETEKDAPTPFEQWVTHIATGTVDDANLRAARNLTELVTMANESAASGRSVPRRPE
ncbi:Gfo/Idh/MocA family protein [Catenulispora pinisilvae]|uniref:Gfo/Idh/MocA family protein n=1 Tax=Catenulispora pinisilvae TaxID=2705253 RepID=UPI001891E0E9|nr:Gfo/Idh/MocA family oxidoreductase [Catenulispora pinisilvae]